MKPTTPFEIIAETVCAYRRMSLEDMVSGKRTRRYCKVRFEICWLARYYTDMSTAEIGRALGGRDHTTILNGLERQQLRLAREPFYAPQFQKLQDTVEKALKRSTAQFEMRWDGDRGLELAHKVLIPGNFKAGLRPEDIRVLAEGLLARERQLLDHRAFAGFIEANLNQLT